MILTGKQGAHSLSHTAAETIPQLDQSVGEDKTNFRELSATIVPGGGNSEKAEAKATTSHQGSYFLNLSSRLINEIQRCLANVKKYPDHILLFIVFTYSFNNHSERLFHHFHCGTAASGRSKTETSTL